MTSQMRRFLWVTTLAMAMALAACGGDADAGDTTVADDADTAVADDGETAVADDGEGAMDGAVSHEEASDEQLETWQTDLNAVGCWAGPVDGTLGPQTEAAIRAFQAAKGLEVDGLLGPVTEGALEEAVAAGETVCSEAPSTDDTGGESAAGPIATLSSAGYGPIDFTIGSCTSDGESDIQLQGEVNTMTLVVEASEMEGTLSVDGGTEGDGITLNGTVESVSVGDAGNFTVTGTFGAPNLEGETFTLEGSCA